MKTIKITYNNGVKEYPFGTRIKEVDGFDKNAIGARMNNIVVPLFQRITYNVTVKSISPESPAGVKIYRRTLCFILGMAVSEEFPNNSLRINHSLGEGYYYNFINLDTVDENHINKIRNKMKEIIEANIPIEYHRVPYVEAIEKLKELNLPDTTLLLENQNKPAIPFNSCKNYTATANGPLADSTGMIKVYGIDKYRNGFILRFPPSTSPSTLTPFEDIPKLFDVFQGRKKWGEILHVNSIGKLNHILRDKKETVEFIHVAETLHNNKLSELAAEIEKRRDEVKVILIAGPSSSGKTTFCKRLSIALRVLGFSPQSISLDNYYLNHQDCPRDRDGKIDFEVIEALDVALLNENLLDLFAGKETIIPNFEFAPGKRKEQGTPMKLGKEGILLIEGIHGLNEKLTPKIPANKKYKVYISALTQLNLDDLNRVSTTDNRILRRMVRDSQFRNYSASKTLKIWPSVRRGERQNIFPYQNSADFMFNSALDYEIPVLKVFAEPLLRSVKPTEFEYGEATRLLNFLDNFIPLSTDMIPPYSILREFLGGSGFKY